MSKEHLIPIKKGETRLGRKGGKVRSKQKKRHCQIQGYRISCCKNCRVIECPYKKYNLSVNPNHVCTIPEVKQQALELNAPVMNEDVLKRLSYEIITTMKDLSGDVKDLATVHSAVLRHWEQLYPKINKNLNVNIKIDTAKEIIDEMFSDEDLK